MTTTDLNGTTCIVTGGGRGLGRSMVHALAGAGANVTAAMHIADDIESETRDLDGNVKAMVADIRGIGMMAGVEVHPEGAPGARGGEMQKAMFWNGLHVKWTGDNAIIAPAFIAERRHVDEIIDKFRSTLDQMM